MSVTQPGSIQQASILIGTRRVPVSLPSRRDPRLRLSAVIVALQVLGQTVLGFKLSIAQILVSVGLAAAIEIAVTWRRAGVLAWPASALLTGNSVAFILRASGTRHGDWWTLHGVHYFALAVVLSLLSKYLIRAGQRHVFNPSNVGLVWTLLIIGPAHVFPQYLWWGPLDAPLTVTLVVIVLGAAWVLRAVRMSTMAMAFLISFAILVALFAATGHSFIAIWHPGPVRGMSYWLDICLSPEVLIFVFFMMSDPQTAPRATRGQIAFGIGTATAAALLLFWQPTEFGIKLAILSSLTLTCGLSALAGVAVKRADQLRRQSARVSVDGIRSTLLWIARGVREPAIAVALIVAVAAPVDTVALSSDRQIVYIEQGLTGARNPQ